MKLYKSLESDLKSKNADGELAGHSTRIWEPLKFQRNGFRLVQLLDVTSNSGEQIINALVHNVALNDPPSCVALLYAWGDLKAQVRIILDGVTYLITEIHNRLFLHSWPMAKPTSGSMLYAYILIDPVSLQELGKIFGSDSTFSGKLGEGYDALSYPWGTDLKKKVPLQLRRQQSTKKTYSDSSDKYDLEGKGPVVADETIFICGELAIFLLECSAVSASAGCGSMPSVSIKRTSNLNFHALTGRTCVEERVADDNVGKAKFYASGRSVRQPEIEYCKE